MSKLLGAMPNVQHSCKPTLSITMACSPKWSEIVIHIDFNGTSHFRPEIVVRVLKANLKELFDAIANKKIFGTVVAAIYTIKFQERGLLHARILITPHESDKIEGASDVDRVACAEIPDVQTQPKLHDYVVKHMMHGSCGCLKPNAACMKESKCSKEFPKNFCTPAQASVSGYPSYRRRDIGKSVDVCGAPLDVRYAAP